MSEANIPEAPAECPPAPSDEQDETVEYVEPPLEPACMDLSDYKPKIDHFEQLHALGQEKMVVGAPNFRQVTDFPVFGCAQPTEEGFIKVLEMVPKGIDEKPVKTIWFNMRQEPVVYINGQPFAPRHPDRMHDNLEVDGTVEEMENLQCHFANIIRGRAADDPEQMLKISKDSAFTENPMNRENLEENVKAKSVKSLKEVYKAIKENGFPNFDYIRVPVVEESAPLNVCFDILVNTLKHEPAATHCAFSCQAGRGRTTLGMVVASLVKEIQISSELRRMGEIGLLPESTVEKIIKSKFEFPLPEAQFDDDPFIKGEFDVIKELVEKLPGAKEGKSKVDRVIDICGPDPKGTGLQNLRECIIETKWKYDVAPEDRQVAFKQMILNFMERYFYLICFATYAKEHGPGGFEISFVQWMDEHKELQTMIDEGKDRLEWTRQVDPEKLNTLKDLINAPNYKENMPTLIRTIYEFAFITYSDLPRGPIKNNSMRKLAAKTLMEILPGDIAQTVQKKLEEQSVSPEFLTLVGMISYYGEGQEEKA
eukprot:GFUD01002224.1.p1 GENE.GFUD01002224.1~~GFUD01002224.1.p1  ORF type:complete len:538 (+),score=154.55 GFUD01002224.1:88-1701(+)